jgi:hypothetical protein
MTSIVRRHWKVTDDKHCMLCVTRAYEDRTHLFIDCNFSKRVWAYLQVDWSMSDDVQSIVAAAGEILLNLSSWKS